MDERTDQGAVVEDADVAAVARLLGEDHRAQFVLALAGGGELSAGELARRAGASSSLTSAHLTKLLDGGLLSARSQGRQRYYRIANAEVAGAVEALMTIAPRRPVRGLAAARRGDAIRLARTCYDHLAGRLGVALTDALERTDTIVPSDSGWELTGAGTRRLERLGVDVHALRAGRRVLIRPCLDWTERRPHLAGALGAAVAGELLELGWINRRPDTRAVEVTELGRRRLKATFGVELPN